MANHYMWIYHKFAVYQSPNVSDHPVEFISRGCTCHNEIVQNKIISKQSNITLIILSFRAYFVFTTVYCLIALNPILTYHNVTPLLGFKLQFSLTSPLKHLWFSCVRKITIYQIICLLAAYSHTDFILFLKKIYIYSVVKKC